MFLSVAPEGLPPQVRGRVRPQLQMGVLGRTTPAGAGTRTRRATLGLFLPDYPRRCGDERRMHSSWSLVTGLPPQVRGRGHQAARLARHLRTTPAGAGTSGRIIARSSCDGDYPRRCGDEFLPVLPVRPVGGVGDT